VLAESSVEVRFEDGRRHRVTIEDCGDQYRLSAFVVRQAVVNRMPKLAMNAWSRNLSTPLVCFLIDRRGRLVGEAWVPKVRLCADEFQLYVRTLAVECDRYEYVLTGRDVE
jgi:hypothetical protein